MSETPARAPTKAEIRDRAAKLWAASRWAISDPEARDIGVDDFRWDAEQQLRKELASVSAIRGENVP